jgi:hypothetical protein
MGEHHYLRMDTFDVLAVVDTDLVLGQSDAGGDCLIHELLDGVDTNALEDLLNALAVIAEMSRNEIIGRLQGSADLGTVQVVELLVEYGGGRLDRWRRSGCCKTSLAPGS